MTRMLAGVGAVATIAIFVAAGAVVLDVGKRLQPADLTVSITGVPGYVFHDRDYEIRFEYAN